jgi:hypothetical protein
MNGMVSKKGRTLEVREETEQDVWNNPGVVVVVVSLICGPGVGERVVL